MSRQKTVAVILLCYNEGIRALNVLKEVKSSKLINEIVVVDDSSDRQSKELLSKVDGIKLITHLRKQGKSRAMKIGVLNVKSDVIVFVDADLVGFKGKYIDDLVKPIINGKLDLVLGDREKEFWIGRLLGLSLILTGERALNRKLLLEHMDIFDHGGYLAEVAMNETFFKNKRIGRVLFKGVGQFMKHKKNGFSGLILDFVGLAKIIKFVGLKEFINQLAFVNKIKKINYNI